MIRHTLKMLYDLFKHSFIFNNGGTDALEYIVLGAIIIPALANVAGSISSKVLHNASGVLLTR